MTGPATEKALLPSLVIVRWTPSGDESVLDQCYTPAQNANGQKYLMMNWLIYCLFLVVVNQGVVDKVCKTAVVVGSALCQLT